MSMMAYRMETNEQTYTNNQEGVIVDFKEYCLKKEAEKKGKPIHRKKGITVLGIIVSAVVGFLAAAGFAALLNVDPEKATFIMYVMWIFFGGAMACLLDGIGGKYL